MAKTKTLKLIPYAKAKPTANTSVNVAGGGQVIIPLVTSVKEQGTINLDLAQNRIYATIDGNYNIKAALQWEDNANDNYYRSIIIKKNGVLLDVQQVAATSGVSGPIQKYTDDFDLVAGDYIELWATQDNAGGGAINVIPDLTSLALKLNNDYYLAD